MCRCPCVVIVTDARVGMMTCAYVIVIGAVSSGLELFVGLVPVSVVGMDGVVVLGSLALDAPRVGVPVVLEHVPAGFPSPAQDYFDGDVDLNEHLLMNRPASFLVRVTGDSMTGVGIYDGDELIVDRSLDPVSGDTVIAVVDDELTVKTLVLDAAGPSLRPQNPAYPTIRPTSEFVIWGVVTTCLHHLHRVS